MTMGWDVALQGIGAGLKGALDAYSWQQDFNEGRRRFDASAALDQQGLDLRREDHELRQKQLKAEIQAMIDKVGAGKVVEKEREAFIAGLPAHLQGPARAKD